MSQITTIPQAVSKRYHACFNNHTYRAFSLVLATALGLDERIVRAEICDERHNQIMNLLIDTSMELAGAAFYAGAGQKLCDVLGAFDEHTPALVKHAEDHLNNFVTGERPWEARAKIAHMATLALAESARRALVQTLDHAALLPGWQGTTPYYWLLACAQIIQSAEIVLREDPSVSYLDEKFGKGIELLARGTDEMVRYGNPPPAIQRFHEQMAASPDRREPDASR